MKKKKNRCIDEAAARSHVSYGTSPSRLPSHLQHFRLARLSPAAPIPLPALPSTSLSHCFSFHLLHCSFPTNSHGYSTQSFILIFCDSLWARLLYQQQPHFCLPST
ncbi:hypothetical protein E2C01_026779 [Portunus trituberculatus]|uniref:Uncharacterized protein n=1 Tax=Portunus trituberculatus TaxID=210409 RepID=A0A5B7EJV7_PORTR|nr:hypothetical protein [Portunus trituberculatus]